MPAGASTRDKPRPPSRGVSAAPIKARTWGGPVLQAVVSVLGGRGADVLQDKRAAYGEQILPTLSAKLTPEYGQGFGERNRPGRRRPSG